MARWVALLRAINVGGRTVRMSLLRTIVEGVGCTRVETVIASGNVLFDSPSRSRLALETRLESALAAALGFEVTTMVRTPVELAVIGARAPFGILEAGVEGQTLYVAVLKSAPDDKGVARLMALRSDAVDFRVIGREAWWLRRKRTAREMSGGQLERALGVPATVRNLTTMLKLAALTARGGR